MQLMHLRATATLAADTLAVVVLLTASASAQSTLSGVYKVDGKAAALTQVAAYKGEAESGQPTTVLVFSHQEPGNGREGGVQRAFRQIWRRPCREGLA